MIVTLRRISVICRNYSLIFPVLIVLFSCEEAIKVNLRNEKSKVVIESFIANDLSPIVVKITKSQEFFDQNSFTPVKNASVQLEYLSKKEKLNERGGGYYVSLRTPVVSGRTYTLKVVSAGETFSATVVLPGSVPIDTVYFKPGIFSSDSLNIFVGFHDPAKTENYYRIKVSRNQRETINDYYLLTDAFLDGEDMIAPIYYRYFAPGDTVVVELYNLERSTWRYYKGLSESIQQGVNSQAPGNPPSNFSGGALGVFGAGGVSSYRLIVPGVKGKK